MRLLPLRPTIGRLMILVAVLAMALGGELARRRWVAGGRPPRSRSVALATALAAKHFGPKHWAASPDVPFVVHDGGRGYWVYARDYRRLGNGGRLALAPFAVIWRSPDGRNVRSVTGDLADLSLHRPTGSGVGLAGLNRGLNLESARLEGNVFFRDDDSTSKRDDALGVALTRVEFDRASLERAGGLSARPGPR